MEKRKARVRASRLVEPGTGRSTFAERGMVAAPHHLASASGVRALEAGGSAVDAAIAANAVLCVAYPHMAGLGGDGFWLIHDPAQGSVAALDASGPAARTATIGYYQERGHAEAIPATGPLSALTVPGAVDGWRVAHERYGRLPWRALFADAIRYARDGVPVSGSLARWLTRERDTLAADAGAQRTFLPHGHAPRVGERLVQPALARTLQTLATQGARAGFYEDDVAERFCRALDGGGSPLAPGDFHAYRAEWVAPASTTYRGRIVYEFPPPTQGFAALAILNLLEGYDIAAWGDGSADYYHHMAEAVKVAFADRDAWLTDPRFVDIPLDRFLDKAYAAERRALIRPDAALTMGEVPAGVPWPGGAVTRRAPLGDTSAFSVVDADGLVVSAIQSLYHGFGSGVLAGDTGIIPQNRGSFFSLDPRHANRLEPGKRTFHTLTPGLLLDGDHGCMAFGTMGGEGQPQTHAALLSRVLDFGYGVQEAIDAPRWVMGRTWGTPSRDLWLEGRIPDAVARDLARRGQPVRRLADWAEEAGHAQAIRFHADTGRMEGGADPRGDGVALGR